MAPRIPPQVPPKALSPKPLAKTTHAAGKAAVKPAVGVETEKVGEQVVVAGESTYKAVDTTPAQLTRVPVVPVGGQQARVAALLKKGQIDSPEALLAKLSQFKSDVEAATFLGDEFAKAIKGAV